MGRDADQLPAALDELRHRIGSACDAADRTPDEITVVGVTKTHAPDLAQAAVDLGLRDLGENRVGELLAKAARVEGARWHFVGRLQSRKVRDLVGHVTMIHSVDRRSLIDEIATRSSGDTDILIQVNAAEDPRKGGCSLDETGELVAYARRCSTLSVRGLMTMPPRPDPGQDPAAVARPVFARLRALRDQLRGDFPELRELSMGMSADLEAAIEEGATIVRVGTALFGARGPAAWEPIRGM